jgi:hypothetical protein
MDAHNTLSTYISSCSMVVTYIPKGKFLVNNYHQALDILKTKLAVQAAMAEQGIESGSVFNAWLLEERDYLKGLKTEPAEEMLQMEYYQRLVNLNQHK